MRFARRTWARGSARAPSGRATGEPAVEAARSERSLRRPRARLRRASLPGRSEPGAARRGHTVQHVYCESYTSGKGRFEAGAEGDLSIVAVPAGECFARYSPVRRISQEAAYGRRFAKVAATFGPDVIVACNVPLVAKSVTAAWCRREGVPWVFLAGPVTARP